jgi:hypothetical protein
MRKTKEQHKKLAKLLEAGEPVCSALEKAGWSPTQAAKGTSKVPLAVYGMLSNKAKRLIKLAKGATKDDREGLVIGRLMENTANGTDKGSLSAKYLGSTRELNLFTPDQMTGVVVLQTPQAIIDAGPDLLKAPEE